MIDDKQIVRLAAMNDQDRAQMRDWVKEASNDDLMRVWVTIQEPYDDPAMEIMSRFAQVALSEAIAEKFGTKAD